MMSWHHSNSKDSRLPSTSLTNMANQTDTTPGISLSLPALQKRLPLLFISVYATSEHPAVGMQRKSTPFRKVSPYFWNFLPSTYESSSLLSTQICPSNKHSKIPPNGTLSSSRDLPLEYFSYTAKKLSTNPFLCLISDSFFSESVRRAQSYLCLSFLQTLTSSYSLFSSW